MRTKITLTLANLCIYQYSLFSRLKKKKKHYLEKGKNNCNYLLPILYFRIPYNTLFLPPKFCIKYCFQMLLGTLHIPKSI